VHAPAQLGHREARVGLQLRKDAGVVMIDFAVQGRLTEFPLISLGFCRQNLRTAMEASASRSYDGGSFSHR
jgi:hypothetical protein